MSKSTHDKELARARAKRRQAAAVDRKRTRIRVAAIVVILAMALTTVGVVLAGRRTSTPRIDEGSAAGSDGATSSPTPAPAPAVEPSPGAVAAAAAGFEAMSFPDEANPTPCDVSGSEQPTPQPTAFPAAPSMQIDTSATYTATLNTTCGTIELSLAAAAAPQTVNNFVFLADQGYYDGVPFHRVIDGFMIQGGDPTGTGNGGNGTYPGYTFGDELALAERVAADNGGYPPGTLAMANAGPDTNGSQFFIVEGRKPSGEHVPYPLQPNYTVFGHLVSGMDVVDRIAQGPTTGANNDQAVTPVRITSIEISKQS